MPSKKTVSKKAVSKKAPPVVLERKPLTAPQRARVAHLWESSIMNAFTNKLAASLQDLDAVLALVPTSARAHVARGTVRERAGDLEGSKADEARAKELAALAKKQQWPADPVEEHERARDAAEEAVQEVPTEEHTISRGANYYWAPVERAHLEKTPLKPTLAAEGTALRIVVGARDVKGGGFEAVAFVEAKAGRQWKALEPVLTGKAASAAVRKLVKADARYGSVGFALDEVLDGFEEQAGDGHFG
jgi:hypothetical protein